MVEFVNLTPHAIKIAESSEFGGTIAYQPSGQVARVATKRTVMYMPGGHRLVAQDFGPVEGLPEPVEGRFYIVSGMVLTALAGSRPDVIAPDTGPDAVRENGQIVAVRGFVC